MESNATLQLKAKNAKLKEQLKEARRDRAGRLEDAIHRKNLQLSALYYVWCNGGCSCMDGGFRGEVTEELVAEAERNTGRLRTWWINKQHRDAVGVLYEAEEIQRQKKEGVSD